MRFPISLINVTVISAAGNVPESNILENVSRCVMVATNTNDQVII